MPQVEIGPAWLIAQYLDPDTEDLDPVGDIVNLLYNQEVIARFQEKEYKIPADNAASHVGHVALGLEEASIAAKLVSISTDILAALVSTARTDAATAFGDEDVVPITGFGRKPYWRVLAIFPNMLESDNIFSVVESGGDLVCTVIEMRIASFGGEALEYAGSKDEERKLPFKANAMTKEGITAVPAYIQRNKTISVSAGELNSATLSAWPITSLYS